MEQAEHFCPALPKAERQAFMMAWSRSPFADSIITFLPPVSAERGLRGLLRAMVCAVWVPPVRMMWLISGDEVSNVVASLSAMITCSASLGTPASQKALAKWKDECHEKDPNLVTLTPNRHNKLFQFALHDKKNRIAYELKLSTDNPRVFLDKLSRTLIIYNTLKEANKDFIGLAEEIAGSDYQPIEKVYIFAYNDFIAEYQKPIIQHYFNMIEQKFCFHIEIKSLED